MTNDNETKQENDKVSKKQNEKIEIAEKGNIPRLREDDWMLKPCDVYLDEFNDCKSFGARFYQNFYYGETLNCVQWKIDYENCQRWQKKDDDTSYSELLLSEKKRRLERLKPHVMNDVWKRREAPPTDWDEPLPDWMMKRQEGTYLAARQKESEENGEFPTMNSIAQSCTIL